MSSKYGTFHKNEKPAPDDGVDRSDIWRFSSRCECGRDDCQDHISGHGLYMVNDKVWKKAGLHHQQDVNPACLEKMLGRELKKSDVRGGDLNLERDLGRKLK